MKYAAAVLICLLATVRAVSASENTAGWQFVRSLPVGASPYGVVTVSPPQPVRAGRTGYRFQVRPGDCSRAKHGWNDCEQDRERAELKQRGGYQVAGEVWWYALSLFVPREHQNIWPAKVTFAQFHQEGAKPVILLQNGPGGLWLEVLDAGRTVRSYKLIGAHQLRARWHDIVMNIYWSAGADGLVRVWIDGAEAALHRGPTMSAKQVYFKFGLYRSHLKRNPNAARITQSVFIDEVRRARTRQGLALAQ